jgi:hypothetical protein
MRRPRPPRGCCAVEKMFVCLVCVCVCVCSRMLGYSVLLQCMKLSWLPPSRVPFPHSPSPQCFPLAHSAHFSTCSSLLHAQFPSYRVYVPTVYLTPYTTFCPDFPYRFVPKTVTTARHTAHGQKTFNENPSYQYSGYSAHLLHQLVL